MTAPVCASCGTSNRAEARFCRSCGTDLTKAADPTKAADLAKGADLTKIPVRPPESFGEVLGPDGTSPAEARRLRRRLIVIGATVAALLLLYLGFVTVQDKFFPPDQPVKELFAALQDRDEDKVRELVRCSSPLCQPGALDSGYEPPQNFAVLGVEKNAFTPPDKLTKRPFTGYAQVTVAYTVAGQSYLQHIRVARNNDGLLFRSWSLFAEPGADVDVVSLTKKTARLGNAIINTTGPPVSGLNPPEAPYAPPGLYALSSSDDPLLVSAPATVVVAGDAERVRADLQVSVNPGATAEVDKLVKARVDLCAQQDVFNPSYESTLKVSCYFGHSTKYAFTQKPRWTIVDYPKVELQITEDTVHGTGAVEVHTVTPGHATITYEYTFQVLEPRTWTQITATEPITPRGPVFVTDGKIAWSTG